MQTTTITAKTMRMLLQSHVNLLEMQGELLVWSDSEVDMALHTACMRKVHPDFLRAVVLNPSFFGHVGANEELNVFGI